MSNLFKITNKYLILLTPLLLYSLISSLYLISVSLSGKLVNIVFAFLLFLLMTAAFASGWFYMIKLIVSEAEEKYSENANSIIKEFTTGVGIYFLPSLGATINLILFFITTLFITYLLGMHFIGDIGLNSTDIVKAFESTNSLKTFLASLSLEQIVKINQWNISILGSTALSYFLVILYLPTIFLTEKNPYKSIIISLRNLFSKKFFKTLGIYVMIFAANFIISVLSAIFGAHTFANFILTLLNFYFLTLVSVGVFKYYQDNFSTTKLGQNVDVKI